VGTSYAAIWRSGRGPVCAGQLVITPNGLYLDGADRSGTTRSAKAGVEEISSLRIGRTPAERIDGRSSVIVEVSGGDRLVISSASGVGLTREIAERVSRLAKVADSR
jgi:hypothetical protein